MFRSKRRIIAGGARRPHGPQRRRRGALMVAIHAGLVYLWGGTLKIKYIYIFAGERILKRIFVFGYGVCVCVCVCVCVWKL